MVMKRHSLQLDWSCFDIPVGIKPTRLAQVPKKGKCFFISLANLSNTLILFYSQDENVTIKNGLPLFPQSTVDLCVSQDLYGIVQTGNCHVRVKKLADYTPLDDQN